MKKYDAIWLTGQPASGKTTLANLLVKKLPEIYPSHLYFNIDLILPLLSRTTLYLFLH